MRLTQIRKEKESFFLPLRDVRHLVNFLLAIMPALRAKLAELLRLARLAQNAISLVPILVVHRHFQAPKSYRK
jgi:hypothetical protein